MFAAVESGRMKVQGRALSVMSGAITVILDRRRPFMRRHLRAQSVQRELT